MGISLSGKRGLWLSLLLCLCVTPPVQANEAELAVQRAELEKLRARLGAVSQALNEATTQHVQEISALAQAQREVSRAGRRLREATEKRTTLAREAAGLEVAISRLTARIHEGQTRLAAWIRHTHIHRHGGSLGQWGLGRGLDTAVFDDEQELPYSDNLQRDLVYLERIGRVHQTTIEALRTDLAEHERLMKTMVAQRQKLGELEERLKAEEAALHKALETRRQKAAEIQELIGQKSSEERRLKEDEARFETLMRELERHALEAKKHLARKESLLAPPQTAPLDEAEAKARAPLPEESEEPTGPEDPKAAREHDATSSSQHAGLSPPAKPAPSPSDAARVRFSQLQGQLRVPVRGPVTVRFGARRPDGGSVSTGIFIRAAQGSDVRAVAAGTVVFSDWLRGFGNLLIIDHGEDYLSIYGNNDVLLRQEYDRVELGDVLASVGDSGNQGQSGLYFEIRHRSRPQDPMRWVTR